MTERIGRRFEAVERQREALQRDALALTDAQLAWTPNPGTWSVGGIVEHLVLADEAFARAGDGTALDAAPLPLRLLPRSWRRAMILAAFRRDVALPLPTPAVDPRGGLPASDLVARWDAARRAMRAGLEGLAEGEPRYAHPILGPLDALQMLDLSEAHTAYHARQAAALRLLPAFPRP